MVTDARQRAVALIERADATLAVPRPEGELWRLRETPPAAPAAPARTLPAAVGARPAAGPFVTRAALDRCHAAAEKAIGRMFQIERMAWQRRVAELERRLDELEART